MKFRRQHVFGPYVVDFYFAALKLVLEMEVTTGQLTEADELPGLDNEKTSDVSRKPLPAGSLLL